MSDIRIQSASTIIQCDMTIIVVKFIHKSMNLPVLSTTHTNKECRQFQKAMVMVVVITYLLLVLVIYNDFIIILFGYLLLYLKINISYTIVYKSKK